MSEIDAERMRKALADLPAGTNRGQTPSPEQVYLPRSHLKAIDPDNPLVTGMRGAGKTFWWSALQNPKVRRLVGGQLSLFAVPRRRSIFTEEHQREKFHVISGPWMGTGRRRGYPYTWVHRALGPLEGIAVPCEFDEIARRWQSRDILNRLTEEAGQNEVTLPPLHIEQGPDGVREDLESLGVFLRMRDGRVNIPDVFRVGYGLGRRGGVKPVR